MARDKFIGIYVDADLRDKIDEAAGRETRSSFLERLIREHLEAE